MNFLKYFALVITLCASLSSCKNDAIESENSKEADAHTQKVTRFIYDQMSTYYLWYDQIPQFDLKYETNPVNYFYNIVTQQDYDNEWSYIADLTSTRAGGKESPAPTFGYFLASGYYDNLSKDVFGIVLYVFPNTPAAVAGIKRGDFITEVNGEFLTEDNFDQLLDNNKVNITLSKLVNGQFITDRKADLQAERVALNPVDPQIIDYNGHKVGYLIYTDFISNFNDDLDLAFEKFRTENVLDIILDLRYNFGGDENAFSYLCSSIAPKNAVDKKSIIITNEWNAIMKDYFIQEQIIDESNIRFDNKVKNNLNLNKIFILASANTSAAAEATILGMFPYMQVNVIGEQTAGRFLSSLPIQAGQYRGDQFIPDPEIGNWYIEPVVAQYKNVNGLMMSAGILPTYAVGDMDELPLLELGNPQEPLLKEALALMNGAIPEEKIKTRAIHPFGRISGRYTSPHEAVRKTLRLTQFRQK